MFIYLLYLQLIIDDYFLAIGSQFLFYRETFRQFVCMEKKYQINIVDLFWRRGGCPPGL